MIYIDGCSLPFSSLSSKAFALFIAIKLLIFKLIHNRKQYYFVRKELRKVVFFGVGIMFINKVIICLMSLRRGPDLIIQLGVKLICIRNNHIVTLVKITIHVATYSCNTDGFGLAIYNIYIERILDRTFYSW